MKRRTKDSFLGFLHILLLAFSKLGSCQLSAPVASDNHISVDGNKYLQRKADLDGGEIEEIENGNICPQNIELRWMSEVSSSIYATPLITDLYSDGRKDIVVPAFVHYLEVLEGQDGAQALGWPAFHKSTVHSSPLLYDIDFDGIRDILVATYNGEILFYKDNGEKLAESITIARLRVRKNWFSGLDPDPINHSHPDVKATDEEYKRAKKGSPPPHTDFPTADGMDARTKFAPLKPLEKERAARLKKQVDEYKSKHSEEEVQKFLKSTAEGDAELVQLYKRLLAEEAKQKSDPSSKIRSANTQETKSGRRLMSVDNEADADADVFSTVGESSRRLMAADADGGLTADGGDGAVKTIAADGGDGDAKAITADSAVFADDAATGADAAADNGAGKADGGVDKTDGSGDGAVPVAEIDKDHVLTQEALDSFEVFKDYDSKPKPKIGLEEDGAALGADDGGDGGDGAGGDGDGSLGDAYPEILSDADPNAHTINFNDDIISGDGDDNGGDAFGDSDALADRDKLLGKAYGYDEFGDVVKDDVYKTDGEQHTGEDDFGAEHLGDSGDEGHELDADHYKHMYLGDYYEQARKRIGRNRFWEDEEFQQGQHQQEDVFVYVDAHVLCTPTIVDLDNDGHDELVVAVSYFYDREYYDNPEHSSELGDIDMGKYLASGIAVYDLRSRSERWVQHLDLSTENTQYKAYAYSAPTVVDLDKDGFYEIVVGTSMGFLYVLDHKGNCREGFPVQMGEIQGQALVADINNDGEVEIVAGDTRGSIAAFSIKGDELWERHMKSMISQGVMAGDVNGDGELELAFGTASGHVYVIRGRDGEDVKNFPFRAQGRITSPVLITRLANGPAQHIVVPAFDGYLYIIDGISGCSDSIDIGETSYSQVLADDLQGNGYMDLVLSTMNGNVYCFETPAEYHPLKVWTSQVMSANGMVARHDYYGIYASAASRTARDVAGEKLQVKVNIIDKRAVFAANGSLVPAMLGPYNISVVLKGVGVAEMNAGLQPVIGVADTVQTPGSYILELPCPRTRSTATVQVSMVDSHGMVFVDEFSLSFHLHFHKLLKWLVALPVAAMCCLLLLLTRRSSLQTAEELPSFHTS